MTYIFEINVNFCKNFYFIIKFTLPILESHYDYIYLFKSVKTWLKRCFMKAFYFQLSYSSLKKNNPDILKYNLISTKLASFK